MWTAGKDSLEDLADEDQVDSWAATLQKITLEQQAKAKEQEEALGTSARGVRRRAAAVGKVGWLEISLITRFYMVFSFLTEIHL